MLGPIPGNPNALVAILGLFISGLIAIGRNEGFPAVQGYAVSAIALILLSLVVPLSEESSLALAHAGVASGGLSSLLLARRVRGAGPLVMSAGLLVASTLMLLVFFMEVARNATAMLDLWLAEFSVFAMVAAAVAGAIVFLGYLRVPSYQGKLRQGHAR